MKKYFLILLITCFGISCNLKTSEEKIENLNGYWEIKSAERPEGTTKEYKISAVVDYIQIKNKEGFRKKVRPQLDGSYLVTEDRESLTVKIENDSINLYYTTPFDSWKETLLSSEENEIKILNPQGIIYTYKRFTPYLENNGEED